jgi:mannose-1-phosphate guanylyltransferase
VPPRSRNTWVVILAGGEGRRLSELTVGGDGHPIPKQYCALNGGASLLQLAFRRALAVTTQERTVCIVNDAHRRWWEPLIGGLRHKVIVQPANRGTGLGILLPLLVIAKTDARAGVVCLPSDHYVEHEDVLAESLRQATAQDVYDSGKITLLGVSPLAADAGFGYVLPSGDAAVGMRSVQRFVEKPDELTTAELIRAGSLWNSGIFSGGVERVIELFPRLVPGMMLDLKSIVEYWHDTRQPSPELCSLYARHPRIDFSSDVLQKRAEHLQLLALPPCGWSDIGTPTRLAKTLWSLRARGARNIPMSGGRTFNFSSALEGAGRKEPPSRSASAAKAKP